MGVESVQSLASLSSDTIPPEFISPETERVNFATTVQGPNVPDIPIVDLGEPDMAKVVEAVAAASREWGICHVVNHGIPEDLINRLQTAGKDFFALPKEEKVKCAKPPETPGVDGYGSAIGRKGAEEKKSWSDYLSHTLWPPSAIDYRYWPQNPPSYREVNEEYASYVRQVADKVFEALSLGLGLEENTLKVAVGGDDLEYSLRINLYPPCLRPDLTIGLAAHTDFCAITIIVPNQVPGLQVLKDDRWFDAKYIPNALIVQISDQIEILSNGKYKSALHRTIVDKEKVRMSWPVFVRPPPEHVVGPLSEMVDHQNPAKFKTNKFKDYMYCKINSIPQDYVHYKYV